MKVNQLIYRRVDFMAFVNGDWIDRQGTDIAIGDLPEDKIIDCLDSGGRILLTRGPVSEMDIISYFKLVEGDGYQEFEYEG